MRRQFKTSLSEERLSVSDICSDDSNPKLLTKSLSHTETMFQLTQMRQKRRLPSILLQHKRQLHRSFWPTYRGAVGWMREREHDLNTMIGLFELYPQIIQETPLDGFWTWLQPLIQSHNTSRMESLSKKRENNSHKINLGTSRNNKNSEKPVPFISITSPSGGERRETVNIVESQLVYVIGKTSSKDFSEKCLIDTIAREIQSHFFTIVNRGCVQEERVLRESCNNLKRSKAVIFIVSDASLNCTTSVRLLRLAWRCNISVIFVRSLAFSLPRPLPDAVFETFRDPHLPMRRKDTTLDNRARSVSPSFANGGNFLHSRFSALRSPTPKKTHRVQSGKSKKFSTELKSTISLQIMDGYAKSLVYNENDHIAFTQHLFQRLSSYIGVTIHPQNNIEPRKELEKQSQVEIKPQVVRLRIPGSIGSVSGDDDSVTGTSEYDSYDEGLDRVFDDDLEIVDDLFTGGMDSGLSSPMEKETTYVVYPSLEYSQPADAPKVVRWPPKNNELNRSMDTFSPFFDSPLGFEDVNLSIIVNSDSP